MTDEELKSLLEAQTARIEKRFDTKFDELRHVTEITTERLRHEIQLVAEKVLMID
jgi:hypothetical protein